MDKLIIILKVILTIVIIILTFFICSNLHKVLAVCTIILIISAFLLTYISIGKENVIKYDKTKIKVVNISYMCPECGEYIPSLSCKYCTKCGLDLSIIEKYIKE